MSGGRDKAIRIFNIFSGEAICKVNMYEDVFKAFFVCNDRYIVALIDSFGEMRVAIFETYNFPHLENFTQQSSN